MDLLPVKSATSWRLADLTIMCIERSFFHSTTNVSGKVFHNKPLGKCSSKLFLEGQETSALAFPNLSQLFAVLPCHFSELDCCICVLHMRND